MLQNSNSLIKETTINYNGYSQSISKNGKTNNTLIVGLNRESIELFERIKNYPALGYKVIGFISLKDHKLEANTKIPILGNFESIIKIIQQNNIKTVLIAIASNQHSYLDQIISICSRFNISYQIVSEVYDTVYGNVIRDIYHDLYQYRESRLKKNS